MKTLNKVSRLITVITFASFLFINHINGASAEDLPRGVDIIKIDVHYANTVQAQRFRAANFPVETAVVGGQVVFSGQGPVYVTLSNGIQKISTLTDMDGNFSFYFLLDSYRYQLHAWHTDDMNHASVEHKILQSKQ